MNANRHTHWGLVAAVALLGAAWVGCGSSASPDAGTGDASATDAPGTGGGAPGGAGGRGTGGTAGGSGGRGATGCVVPATCCAADGDCQSTEECVMAMTCAAGQTTTGMCKPRPQSGSCWRAADCPAGTCAGAQVCPCGAACLVADRLGNCSP